MGLGEITPPQLPVCGIAEAPRDSHRIYISKVGVGRSTYSGASFSYSSFSLTSSWLSDHLSVCMRECVCTYVKRKAREQEEEEGSRAPTMQHQTCNNVVKVLNKGDKLGRKNHTHTHTHRTPHKYMQWWREAEVEVSR